MNPYKKILVIQTAFLGDVILITPLIRAVHDLFPNAQIDALVLPQTASILTNNPYLSNIIKFDKRGNKWISFFRTVKMIRNTKYDLAISPHSSVTTAYLMLLGGINERLGFDRWHAAKYLTLKVPHLEGIHKIKKNLHLLSVFTEQEFDMQSEIFPDAGQLNKYRLVVKEIVSRGNRVIALAPGSVWNTKRWPEEHYTVLSRLLSKSGYRLLFIGGPEESELCTRIIRDAGINAENFAGKTTPLDSAALLTYCDLLICNDSGAMHIANAVKTDIVAFFGPTVQSIGYYPFRNTDIVMELDMDCRPCGSHGGNACPLGHHNCMKHITPQAVLEIVNRKFKDI